MNKHLKHYSFPIYFIFIAHFLIPLCARAQSFENLQAENDSKLLSSNDHPYLPVDITFLVADLKYNASQGVKICEIQPGSMCGFYTKDPIPLEINYPFGPDGDEVAEIFCNYLFQYTNRFWFIDAPIDLQFKQKLKENGWIKSTAYNRLIRNKDFAKFSQMSPQNHYSIDNYYGIVYASYKKMKKEKVNKFLKDNPGIILLDASIYPYVNDKIAISEFLSKNEKSRNLRPAWKSYPKQYFETLADTIYTDLKCNIFVIKPVNSLQGRGIIIAQKEDLDTVLKKILDKSQIGGINTDDDDVNFNYWKKDLNTVFIVEEFVESDPISVAHLNNQLFDATMRIAFFLVYNQGKIEMYFLGQEWQIPEKALDDQASLTLRHKSSTKNPYFTWVDPLIIEKVHKQLREGLPPFYEELLGITNRNR